LARHEKDFDAAGEAQLPPREALSLSAARGADHDPANRVDALARFLSAEDGWIEAARRLDGAFALDPAVKNGGKV
jgi:hypothetical protein